MATSTTKCSSDETISVEGGRSFEGRFSSSNPAAAMINVPALSSAVLEGSAPTSSIGILDSNQHASVQGNAIGSYTASAGGTQIFHQYVMPPNSPPSASTTSEEPTFSSRSSILQSESTRGEYREMSSYPSTDAPKPPKSRPQVYFDHLVAESRGSPLWLPGPDRRLPIDYRRKGLSVGDVGILNPDGGFSFLFNVFMSSKDSINLGRVPPSFESLSPPDDMDFEERDCFGEWSAVTSRSVKRSDQASFQFESLSDEGAILTMPQGASSTVLQDTERLEDYLNIHIKSWYDFLLRRGRKLQNGDIRVVYGCDKVSTWGIATFLSQSSAQASGQVAFKPPGSDSSIGPTLIYECRGSAQAKTGPQEGDIAEIYLKSIRLSSHHKSSILARGLECFSQAD